MNELLEILQILIDYLFYIRKEPNLCRSGRRLIAGGGESGQTSVLLLLVNALSLGLWQLQETVHGPQVDQQRLGGV